jgi:hypothetical protein
MSMTQPKIIRIGKENTSRENINLHKKLPKSFLKGHQNFLKAFLPGKE